MGAEWKKSFMNGTWVNATWTAIMVRIPTDIQGFMNAFAVKEALFMDRQLSK